MTEKMDRAQSLASRRKDIADAARRLAAEQGWDAVTVRAVAARLGCSAPALYQYFRDKEAILQALAAEGRSILSAQMEQVLADAPQGPAKRLRIAVRALWDFAVSNPELYAVMSGLSGVEHHGGPGPALALLRRTAEELAVKRDAPQKAADLADSLIASAHGFIALTLAGAFPGGADRAQALLLTVADDLIKATGR